MTGILENLNPKGGSSRFGKLIAREERFWLELLCDCQFDSVSEPAQLKDRSMATSIAVREQD